MEEETKDLENSLRAKIGKVVKLTYVDVESDAMKNYPKIPPLLTDSNIRLPLIVLNEEPRFCGGISADIIGNAVREILSGEKKQGQ